MRPSAISALLAASLLAPRPAPAAAPPPGAGVRMPPRTGGVDPGLCPLDHRDVKIQISGDVVAAKVPQPFKNPFKERIEAVYAFPLPAEAAVHGYEMRVG